MTESASPTVPGPSGDGPSDHQIRILSPDDEETRRIGKAVASSTAGDILRFIGEDEQTAGRIAEGLSLPVSTVMYHLDSLEKAGLIEVVRTRYSVKGREVKIYRLTRQILIVTPVRSDIREQLLKYASLFAIPVGSFLIALVAGQLPGQAPFSDDEVTYGMAKEALGGADFNEAPQAAMAYATEVRDAVALPVPAPDYFASQTTTTSLIPGIPDLALGLLIGGSLVVLALILTVSIRWLRSQR